MTLTEMFDLTDRQNSSTDRLDLLEARIDELEEMLGLKHRVHFDRRLNFSRTHERFLKMLLSVGRLSQLAAFTGLYGDRAEEEEPSTNILGVHVCALRRKLKPYGITIHTVHGWGWELRAEDRAKLCQLMR